ncbi:MAG: hypothetical protein E4G90_07760 [Gemmatimonadales bacterium]|jgi:hypothetical protein|nr:MAG: hypothetical protein E4G90_07760 [Gemmatimonadales bacterium]
MIAHRMNKLASALVSAIVVGTLIAVPAASAQDKGKVDLTGVPQPVMEALNVKFPKAEIQQWTKEHEDGIVIYDIEMLQEGRKFEADIKEDGGIHNWEREIAASDLPEAVAKAVDQAYPKATLKEIMAVTAVENGVDELEGYEIVLDTADKKEVELTVAPDGTILEDSTDAK